MTVVQQQGMEVFGVNLSPSVSVKDRFAVRPHVMLNACLSLSWPSSSIQAGSLGSETAHPGGSKDVREAIGVSPR